MFLNIFKISSVYAKFSQSKQMVRWKNDYLRGTGMEMYKEILSITFVGLLFKHAAE